MSKKPVADFSPPPVPPTDLHEGWRPRKPRDTRSKALARKPEFEFAEAICDVIDLKLDEGFQKLRAEIAERIRSVTFTGSGLATVALDELATAIEKKR